MTNAPLLHALSAHQPTNADAASALLAFHHQAAPPASRNSNSLKAAAEDFEAQFLTTMLAEAFKTIELQAPFNGGAGEDQFQDFLYQEYGKLMASNGGIGLSEAVMAQQAQAAYGKMTASGN